MPDKLVVNKAGAEFVGYRVMHNWTSMCGLWELTVAFKISISECESIFHNKFKISKYFIYFVLKSFLFGI
jgi:hypothetical protein